MLVPLWDEGGKVGYRDINSVYNQREPTMNMMQPEPTLIDTIRAIDDFGQEYVVHTVIREFTSDRKLQRAVDESRPQYLAKAIRGGNIVESSLPGEHTFTFMRQGTEEGAVLYYYRRVYKLVGQEYSGEG